MNLNSWKAYQDLCKINYFPQRIGFPAGVKGPEVNRFNTRVRLAKSFRGLGVVKYSPDTIRGYNALVQVFLTHSALEGFLRIKGLDPQDKAIKKLGRLSSLMDSYGSEKMVEHFFAKDSKNLLYEFLFERVNEGLQKKLHACKNENNTNVTYLSASIRHIFVHGDLSANANGLTSPTLYPLCMSISEFLLNVMDSEFTKQIEACHRRIYDKKVKTLGGVDVGHPESDMPRTLCRPAVRVHRRTLLQESHVAPLTDYVNRLRLEAKQENYILSPDKVPDFDPLDGGVEAQCLFVFEAPGPEAVKSGFVSRNNDDDSAANFFALNRDVGLPRYHTVSWNIVPWTLETDGENRNATRTDIGHGEPYLKQLLDLLPQVRVVVLSGDTAQQGERVVREYFIEKDRPVEILKIAHPGKKVQNLHADLYSKIPQILREAANLCHDAN